MKPILVAVTLLFATVSHASDPPPPKPDPAPCKKSREARQLDFWVGEWEVHDPAGHLVGHSSIQRIVGDCIVYENWTGMKGGVGKSFNFWDAKHERWQQTWVDDHGGVQQYHGQLSAGSMRYANIDQSSVVVHLTFTPLPGGKVRQLSETSKDAGKTFTTEYDFTYSPMKK